MIPSVRGDQHAKTSFHTGWSEKTLQRGLGENSGDQVMKREDPHEPQPKKKVVINTLLVSRADWAWPFSRKAVRCSSRGPFAESILGASPASNGSPTSRSYHFSGRSRGSSAGSKKRRHYKEKVRGHSETGDVFSVTEAQRPR